MPKNKNRSAQKRRAKSHSGQTPHDSTLQAALGQVVREFRRLKGFGISDLAQRAELSPGMVSKIENGVISPSLGSIRALARALEVPVTSLFREFDEITDATFVRAGQGLRVNRDGLSLQHEYQVLGQTTAKGIVVEPYLMAYGKDSKVLPFLHRSGTQFIYMLEGKLRYRHGKSVYLMSEGDSLLFQADVPHGPEELIRKPVRYLSVLSFLGGMGG